jgi:branched-chain amino acid transport system ATP-binding protein
MALKISVRVQVLEIGRIVKEGQSIALLNDEEIKKAYLGL